MTNLLEASLTSTIDKADFYALTMLASSVAFVILCFPEAQKGQAGKPVKWQLLGFPLNFQPALALVVLYCIFFFSALLTDNMLLHVGDIALRINDTRVTSDLLMHPSVLTVSPIGRFVTTAFPSLLVVLGLWRLRSKGQYVLPGLAWWLLMGWGFSGALIFLGLLQRINRYHLPLIVSGT